MGTDRLLGFPVGCAGTWKAFEHIVIPGLYAGQAGRVATGCSVEEKGRSATGEKGVSELFESLP